MPLKAFGLKIVLLRKKNGVIEALMCAYPTGDWIFVVP